MKYIDADKLLAVLERQNVDKKVIEPLIRIIDSLEEPDKDLPMPEDTLIFRKGVKEGKRLMMEEAVEGEVIKTDKHTSIRYKSFYGTDRYFYGIADKQFKPGDKVRIIILPKEDEK